MTTRHSWGIFVVFNYFIINYCYTSEICWDKFDSNYKNQCLAGEWQQRYYFDHASLTCRLFWYDGCPGSSRNVFDDLLTCQWLCEEQPRYSSKSCLQPFDEHYRDECNGGRWRQQYFFDKTKRRCTAFWYDGCKGDSENIFQDEITCVKMCENDAKKAEKEEKAKHMAEYYENQPSREIESYETEYVISSAERKQQLEDIKAGRKVSQPSQVSTRKEHKHRHHKQKQHRPRIEAQNDDKMTTMAPATSVKPQTICETSNPCQNNGKCIFDTSKNEYYCKCAPGFTNDNCTERIDADPCASHPCQNGATCAAKASTSKISYECICLPEYGGINCEARPCDDDPCKNNGTCRTTRSVPAFFCDCSPEWGGKHCEIPVPITAPVKYGKNVKLVSSGQPEWIEELKKRKAKSKIAPPPIKTVKDLKKEITLNDGPAGNLTSAERFSNSSEPLDLDSAQKAGHTGGEFSSSSHIANLKPIYLAISLIISFFSFKF